MKTIDDAIKELIALRDKTTADPWHNEASKRAFLAGIKASINCLQILKLAPNETPK